MKPCGGVSGTDLNNCKDGAKNAATGEIRKK